MDAATGDALLPGVIKAAAVAASEIEREKNNDLPDKLRTTPWPVDQRTERTVQDGAEGDYRDAALHTGTRRSRRGNASDRQSYRIQGCANARLRPGPSPDQDAETGALNPGHLAATGRAIIVTLQA